MKILQLVQESDEWLAHRATSRNASEAAIVLNFSKQTSRQEYIRIRAGYSVKEFSEWVQKNLFDKGHEVEDKARPVIADLIGEAVYPITGTSDDGYLSASFDGITMDESTIWENKLDNKDLSAYIVTNDDLPDSHWPQVEQQLMISKAERCLFTLFDKSGNMTVEHWYKSRPERQAQIMAAWQQADVDLANYQHVEIAKPVVADAQMSLPAVSIRVDGAIAIIDNLDEFTEAAAAYTDQVKALVKKADKDDQDFANLSAANKKLKEVEELLDASENNALSQIEPVEIMRRKKAYVTDMIRGTRLLGEKAEKSEKENRRADIVNKAKTALFNHVSALNTRLGKNYMPVVISDFPGVIKGKKTITSLQDAADAELARCKILANEIADNIQTNLNTLRDMASDYKTLFSDAATIVLKNNDDLVALVKSRIADFKTEQDAKAERERIEKERQAEAWKQADAIRMQAAERERNEADVKALKNSVESLKQTAQPVASPAPQVTQQTVDQASQSNVRSAVRTVSPVIDKLSEPASAEYDHTWSGKFNENVVPMDIQNNLKLFSEFYKTERDVLKRMFEAGDIEGIARIGYIAGFTDGYSESTDDCLVQVPQK